MDELSEFLAKVRECQVKWKVNRRVNVSRSGYYYLDLYCIIKIKGHYYVLVVEVDEEQHETYPVPEEKTRLKDMHEGLGLPMIVSVMS